MNYCLRMEINLPLYKSVYSLSLIIFNVSKNLNKEYKYTIGENLKNNIITMLSYVAIAINSDNKLKYLKKCRKKIEKIRIIVRLLKDLKQISVNNFIEINEKIENISKQITGWNNFLLKPKPNT